MDFVEIGRKWQKIWNDKKTYKVTEEKDKKSFYILDMFPYPSGAWLHVGHPKWYIATDVIARKHMLQWEKVLHPMGFDTFWLGTEQYAIANKMKPQVAAAQNIATYKKQLEMFGCTYDWDREVNTADPKYFKWTQQTFLKLYDSYFDEKDQKAKHINELESLCYSREDGNIIKKLKKFLLSQKGQFDENNITEKQIKKYIDSQRLAYVDYKPINRCPSCKTWLANEDLNSDWTCERCASMVEQKPMKQWVIRITKYAERLLDWLNNLPDRSDSARDQQKNRIGKSEWTQFEMKVAPQINNIPTGDLEEEYKFEVYTTRIDTVFGMSFVAIAPEHPLVDKITTADKLEEVQKYKEEAKHKTSLQRTELEKDKSGVFCGAYAINPFNNQKVAIFVADYVLAWYGTWVVMAVPAHDERDFEFAKKYGLDINVSIAPYGVEKHGKEWYEVHQIDSFTSIIKNNDDKYVVIRFNKGRFGFVWWKLEWEESIEDSLKREIVEETWYSNFEIEKTLFEDAFWCGYKPHKDRIDRCHDKVFVVNILWDDNLWVSEEEKAKHTIHWYSKQEVSNLDLVEHHKIYWDKYIMWEWAYVEKWVLVNSGEFSLLESDEAIEKMQKWLEKQWVWWKKVNYRLQDRVFSRQRYRWEPIPMIECKQCGLVPMDENDLPLEWPDVENYEPTGTEEWPLADIDERINVKCPKCGWNAKRESNTMPGWAGSSRYWMRYMDPQNENEILSPEKEKYWHPVDIYVWWAEHITRHMIYARFWHKFLQDLWTVSVDEPFKKYQHVWLIMAEDGRKMSKRRWNVINPDDIINEFGSDVLRMYEMFMGPFDQAVSWNTNGVKWIKKFLDRVVNLYEKIDYAIKDDKKILNILHKTIKKITEDIDKFGFNTAISQMMILVNELTAKFAISKNTFEKLIILLAPFAPHLSEEFWHQLWNEFSIFNQNLWPKYDEKYLVEDTITMAVQINWKVRWTIDISPDASQEDVMNVVVLDEKISKYIIWDPKKIIYIKGKILNIVV